MNAYLVVFVVEWLFELQLDVCVHNAYLFLRFALGDADGVVTAGVVDIDFVALGETRVVGQLCLEYCLRVA